MHQLMCFITHADTVLKQEKGLLCSNFSQMFLAKKIFAPKNVLIPSFVRQTSTHYPFLIIPNEVDSSLFPPLSASCPHLPQRSLLVFYAIAACEEGIQNPIAFMSIFSSLCRCQRDGRFYLACVFKVYLSLRLRVLISFT